MKNSKSRRKWVMKKWLHDDEFQDDEKEFLEKFAKTFKMGNLLLFYYIEAHTDRVVASAFAKALYCKWVERFQQEIDESFRVNVLHQHKPTAPPLTPETDKLQTPSDKPPIGWPKIKIEAKDIGWKDPATVESGIEESGPSTSSIPNSAQSSETPIPNSEQSVTPKNSRFYRPNISLRTNSKIDPMNSLKLPKEKKKQKEKNIEENGEDQEKFYSQKKCTIT
uniref:Uncharacterized protein n=1 Tax=Panagrolaimus sp. ES5 TaxID=591445 RepID=A0AC34FT83_9BILA